MSKMNHNSQDQQKLLKLLLQKKGIGVKTNTIPTRNPSQFVPLSFSQERLWFLYQLEAQGYTYNMPFRFQIEGNLDIEIFRKALETIMQRHELLRTCFQEVDEIPRQIINPKIHLNFTLLDLQSLSSAEQTQELERLTEQEIYTPFDLTQAPLMRTFLVKIKANSYLLFLSLHHSIFDGWSMKVLLEELSSLYQAFLQKQSNPLPDLPIQYGDFAVWQRQKLQGDKLTQEVNYWQQKLTGIPPLLEIPTDHPRPPIQTFKGNNCTFKLSPELSQHLKNISQTSTATLNMTLLTAFNILLYRYSSQEDIVIGIPSGNRQFPEIEPLIGCFINTLPIRTQFKENLSFKALLNQVKQVVLEAYEHQDLPLEKVVEAVNPQRNISYSPLFQVMFSWEDMLHINHFSMADLKLTPVTMNALIAQFDLTLAMQETTEGLVGSFDYNCALFNQNTIERMITHFKTLLEGIAVNPEQSIELLPILPLSEQKLLAQWNQTNIAENPKVCIHELFEHQVLKTPNDIAIEWGKEKVTYQDLNYRANQLAHYLQSKGVKVESLVGICLEQSVSIIISFLAILKMGAAYLVLAPNYPQERLNYILNDAQVSVLITQNTLVNLFRDHQAEVVCLDNEENLIVSQSQNNLVNPIQPNNLAYIIYTSGSTGTPKGVMIEHQSLVNHSLGIIKAYDLTSRDRILQFASFTFDVAAEEIYPTFLTGATLVMRPALIFPSLADFTQFIQHNRLTVINLPATYWHEWVLDLSQTLITLPETLRLVITGSEEVLPERLILWQKILSNSQREDITWLNAYGPTEATITTTVFNPNLSHKIAQIHSVAIGKPITNTQVYICDRYCQQVPIGIPGELLIGGLGLAKGYLNRDDLTREKFITHAFNSSEYQRFYKTGDLARYLPDGNIEFLGRIDNQVKIRGFRIEIGEIEAVLTEYPDVRVTAVIVREDQKNNKQLVAYIVPKSPSIDPAKLRSFLKQKLPDYMIPAFFVQLQELPLMSSGKIDRNALPAPTEIQEQKTMITPRTATEKIVAEIWQDVLGLKQISIFDNFFDLGGHSLKAAQVISRLREQLAINIPLNYLFSEPTVAGLSSNLDLNLSDEIESDQIPDWQVEITLDPSIQPPNLVAPFPQKPADILLTGATGFLGIHLLAELLDKTEANIHCLIRDKSLEQAQAKIYQKLKIFQLWDEQKSSRIIPVIGDLSQKRLGMCEPDFLDLGNQIDVIYHNGAWVNAIYPYSILKPTNVLGTAEILRLACLIKTKPVHFVSTISIFSPSYAQGNLIQESDLLGINHGLNAGYTQSKWVAEKLIMEAGKRGLPMTIFRASRIIGHSKTGICNREDLFCRMIKGCIQLGMIPDFGDSTEDLTPVDYVSGAIIHLASQESSLGKAFHLLNSHPTLNRDLFDCVREMGYPLQLVSFEKWRSHLTEQCKINTDNALSPVLDNFSDENLSAGYPPQFDAQNTVMGLKGTAFNFPKIDDRLLKTYFEYFTKIGFLTQ
ncbi:MAG: amino acid adenylation domain-containing protein [Microcystis aeruginosa K13-05]|jgi:amino acid adenylation domain-containing protein/thioester reductase-like protein|uniref:non-ribosomal peptide synthetase family protein n=3 Tax=unclassified Microcystis TaxID=2643300 RepID=UPI00338F2730|nr:amino acid adenylation domain-containing protein [Microcystis aeruginosa K13-10]NCR83248.1 amino acid adenylation domain-containing protein [Microcystis aeruginosa K13-05]